jgi:alkanesulfonate monooxygenase SsuD/methylene tetrahydromethanopterin reductase-like flavin-dependent oxidoreductase (luciferase family)
MSTLITSKRGEMHQDLDPSRRQPIFGLSIVPKNIERAFRLSSLAEELGLDLIGVQDHPYNGSFLDTWTLISALASSKKTIRHFPDVSQWGVGLHVEINLGEDN